MVGDMDQVRAHEVRAETLGLAGRVTFTGQVHPSSIPSFMQAADVIVSTRSSGTNTPLKIYSYPRSGVPIVATDLPTHTQTLNHSVAELTAATAIGSRSTGPRLPQGRSRGARRGHCRHQEDHADQFTGDRDRDAARRGDLSRPHPRAHPRRGADSAAHSTASISIRTAMYRYDEFDAAFVNERTAQFRDQVNRRLAGEINEDQFRPLG